MTSTRLKVLRYFLSGKTNVNPKDIFQFFFGLPYSIKAKSVIKKIEPDESFEKIFLKEIGLPLFYPNDISRKSLYQVIVECFDKRNWHFYEINETRVSPQDVVVDCGAAEGLFGLLVYNRCKKVYLIEPLPKFVTSLKKTFQGCNNVEIIPCAVADAVYESKLSENGIASVVSNTGNGISINVTTLDDLFFEKNIPVTYLKLDLEGYDYKALVGTKELIKKNKPKIAVTTYHLKEHAAIIEDFLKSIVPSYHILKKGIYQETGSPVMLHAWI